jgi:hypothetical protein
MIYALSADFVVLLHLAFIIYVVLGGLLVWRWLWTAWVHIPVALYGVAIEWIGWVCPLTPLEKECRRLAGQAGYDGGFIDHYLLPIMYPSGLTDRVQIILGALVLGVNLIVYVGIFAGRTNLKRS